MNLSWLALKNLSRNKYWTVITIGISVISIGCIFISFIILNGVGYSIEAGRERLGTDLVVFPSGEEQAMIGALQSGKPALFYMRSDMTDKVRKIEGVAKASPELYLMTLSRSCCSVGLPFRLIGFDPQTDFVIMPWLARHRISSLGTNEVIIGSDIPSMKGQAMKLLGKDFNVIGVLEKTGIGMDKSIFMPIDSARALGVKSLFLKLQKDEISTILIKVKPGYDIKTVADIIKMTVPGTAVMGSSQLTLSIKSVFDRMMVMVILIFAVILVLSITSITSVYYAMGKTRSTEIGILRSIGAKRKDIFKIILLEAVFSTAIGGVIGIALSAFLVYDFNVLLAKSLPFPFILNGSGTVSIAVICLALSLLLGVVGAVYPAWRASRMDPFDAIRQGA